MKKYVLFWTIFHRRTDYSFGSKIDILNFDNYKKDLRDLGIAYVTYVYFAKLFIWSYIAYYVNYN